MAPVRVLFSPGFISGGEFTTKQLILRGSRTLEERLSRAQFPQEAALTLFSFPLEHLKIGEKHALRKIPPQRADQHEAPFIRKILLLGEFPTYSAPGQTPF
jgi:hypothetical protein